QPLLFPSSHLSHNMLQRGLMAVSAAVIRLSQPKLPSHAVGGSSPFPPPLLSFQQELLTLQSHLPDCLDKLSKLCVLVSHPYLGSEARTKERDCTVGKTHA